MTPSARLRWLAGSCERHFKWCWGAWALAFWGWLLSDGLGQRHLPVWLTLGLGGGALAAQAGVLAALGRKAAGVGGIGFMSVRARNGWILGAAAPSVLGCVVTWCFIWYAAQTRNADMPAHLYWTGFLFGVSLPFAVLLGGRWLRTHCGWPGWSLWAVASVALLPFWQLLLYALESAGSAQWRSTLGWGGAVVVFCVGLLWTLWVVETQTQRREESQRAGAAAGASQEQSACSFKITVTLALIAGFAGADRWYARRWGLGLAKMLAIAGSVWLSVRLKSPWPALLYATAAGWWLADLWLLTSGRYVAGGRRRVLASLSPEQARRSAVSPLEAMDHSAVRAPGHVASPFDLNAWYYGAHNQKLKQSLGALCGYSLLFLCILTVLSNLTGCQQIYELPAGGGKPFVPQKVQVIKQVIRKKFVVNPFSSILFNPPPIDQVRLQLEALTQHVYQAGQGEGQGAGFAGGTGLGMVRFIRLRYADGDWDQDMELNSDLNMLIWYAANTGHRTAPKPEVLSIAQLRTFPVGKSPPLVYLTGQRNLPLSPLEIETLRDYLLEKRGMLFADNGGSSGWHSQFFSLMNQVLPRVGPRPVPMDHPIHAGLVSIPIVAPHGGSTAYGWMIDGRLAAYYHPGDIGDAWADGHSGVSRGIWEASYRLGGNVMLYAHAEYSKWLQTQRKK